MKKHLPLLSRSDKISLSVQVKIGRENLRIEQKNVLSFADIKSLNVVHGV